MEAEDPVSRAGGVPLLALLVGAMTTARERELLERCLRLEAERLGVAVVAPAQPFTWPKRTYTAITPALIAQMRTLYAQGMRPYRIGQRLGCSHTTVRRWVREGGER